MKQIFRKTNEWTDRQIYRRKDGQKDTQKDGLINKQTDGQTDKYITEKKMHTNKNNKLLK